MEQKLSPRRRLYDRGLRFLVWLCAGLTCALLLFLIGYIFYRGVPGITWSLLTSQTSYIKDTVGVLPNILNTLYIIVAAMVIVLPLGVGAAIDLTEYATNRRLVAVIAAVPSTSSTCLIRKTCERQKELYLMVHSDEKDKEE